MTLQKRLISLPLTLAVLCPLTIPGDAHATGLGEVQRWNDYFAIDDGVEVPTTGDFDGDGLTDVIDFSRGTGAVYVARSNGGAFGSAEVWSWQFAVGDELPMVGDFNGDGRDDIVLFRGDAASLVEPLDAIGVMGSITSPGEVRVALSTGAAFDTAASWQEQLGWATEAPLVGDANGDGLHDLILVVRPCGDACGTSEVYVALSTGTSFDSPFLWMSDLGPGDQAPHVGDFNGDGLADLATVAGVVNVALSDGASFGQASPWGVIPGQGSEVPLVGDFDADGCDDLAIAQGDVHVALADCASGAGFHDPQIWQDDFGVASHAGDVDGDGLVDLVAFAGAASAPGDVLVALNLFTTLVDTTIDDLSFPIEVDACFHPADKLAAMGGEAAFGSALLVDARPAMGLTWIVYERGSLFWSLDECSIGLLGAVHEKYFALDGPDGLLGAPVTDSKAVTILTTTGQYAHFDEGSIYASAATGAHEIHGAIRGRYLAGGLKSKLGFPKTDELVTADEQGRVSHFQNGSVYWRAGVGAFMVKGSINIKYAALNTVLYGIGYPTSDEQTIPGVGWMNHFQHGAIFSTVAGTWAVATPFHTVRDGFAARLGYPTMDQGELPGGVYQNFQTGSIYMKAPYPGMAFALWGPVHDRWREMGAQASLLGWPLWHAYTTTAGMWAHFSGGDLYYTPATGARYVLNGPIRTLYSERGGATGSLGYPMEDTQGDGPGRFRQRFEGGLTCFDPALNDGKAIVTISTCPAAPAPTPTPGSGSTPPRKEHTNPFVALYAATGGTETYHAYQVTYPSSCLDDCKLLSMKGTGLRLRFVKDGESSEDCEVAGAFVEMGPFETLSPDKIAEIFGSSTPVLPRLITACAESLDASVIIQVTHTTAH